MYVKTAQANTFKARCPNVSSIGQKCENQQKISSYKWEKFIKSMQTLSMPCLRNDADGMLGGDAGGKSNNSNFYYTEI